MNIHKIICYFQPHAFVLRLHTYRRNIPISKLLMNYFVCERYNRLEWNEVNTTLNTVLWNIASTKQSKEVFNVTGLCGAQVFDMNDNFI